MSQTTTPAAPPARNDDRRGLECRHCGCKHFRVVYTRPTWGGRIMRRRECRHCGKRMTPWERAGDDDSGIPPGWPSLWTQAVFGYMMLIAIHLRVLLWAEESRSENRP